mgnify:CR=1 FL=1
MFFTIEKFQKRVEELKARRYLQCRCIAPFVSMPDEGADDEVHLTPVSYTHLTLPTIA